MSLRLYIQDVVPLMSSIPLMSHVDCVNLGLRLAVLVHLELYSNNKRQTAPKSYINAQNDSTCHK